jgi:hypothetical protein
MSEEQIVSDAGGIASAEAFGDAQVNAPGGSTAAPDA